MTAMGSVQPDEMFGRRIERAVGPTLDTSGLDPGCVKTPSCYDSLAESAGE